MSITRHTLLSLALVGAFGIAHAGNTPGEKATKPDNNRSDTVAPVTAPETDPAMSNSGALVPGQPIRPEGDQEATVPKTDMDKSAASSADVGTDKTNEKTKRQASGGDGSTSPKR